MFRGEVLGVMYHSWETYKKAWNDAVKQGKLFDKNGRKIYEARISGFTGRYING